MRRSVALAVTLAALLAGHDARAEDPHDLFGIGNKKPKPVPDAEACKEPHAFGCPFVADPFEPAPPFALSTWLPASYLRRLPVADATHDALAGFALGALRDDVGLSFGGATGLENVWSLHGAPIQSLRTGGAESRIPLSFLEGLTVTAGGFSARDHASTGGTIDAVLRRGTTTHELDATVWGGYTAESRRRPFARGSYFVRRITADAGPDISASVVGTGPITTLAGGTTWYAAGIAPAFASALFTWKTARLVDGDGDGSPDGLPGTPLTEPLYETSERTPEYFVPAMLRTGWDRGPHHVELTLYGQRSHGTRMLGNATLQAAGLERDDTVIDGIATYRGVWKRTRATVQLAWHRSVHRESATDAAAERIPQLLSAYIPTTLAEEPALAAVCNDNTYPNITQCEVPFGYFASGGVGPLLDLVGDRPTATADVTHVLDTKHTLRAGATLEDSRLATRARFSGGMQTRSLIEGVFDSTQRYYHGECEPMPDTPCGYASASELTYRTRYTAAYVEDTWTPEADIRVNGGLRWELMWVGPRLHFSNQLAPRGGIAWDVLGGGRSRVWTSYGRSFVTLPAGIGSTVIRRDPTVTEAVTTISGSGVKTRDVDPGASYSITDGIRPMAQDELTAGIEVGLAKTVRLTAWAQGRWLRYGLETTPHGFDNPGRQDGQPARRSSELLALEVATTPTGKLTLRAGYLVGKTIGNFLGAYDPRQGAILYNGTQFDGTGDGALTSSNEMGRLPTDAGHRVFVEADRRGTLGPVGIEVAARLTLASGRPRNVYADTDIGVISFLPRGSIGRGPLLSQANVRIAAHWQGFDVTLDVFNAFDRAAATATDELYTAAEVRPIEGGTYEDLVFAKTVFGQDIGRRTAFGLPIAFQGPVSAVLGVHRAF